MSKVVNTPEAKAYMAQTKELHKPVRRSFPRRKVMALHKDHIWSCDLVDMGEWASENDGYRYMRNCVDVFTRFAWSRPLKTKSGREVFEAFLDITQESKRQPRKIWVDQGKEFYNAYFEKWCMANHVEMYST